MNKPIDQPEIDKYVDLWGLEPAGAAFSTHSSVLFPATQDGIPVMLKLTPEPDEIRGGALLAWFDGEGAVQVLQRSEGAILMERPTCNRSLFAMALDGRDDEAVDILCAVAAELHRSRPSAPPPVAPLEEFFAPLLQSDSQDELIRTGCRLATELLAAQSDITVLHGDIHHRNVLDAGVDRWLAIDPKGLYGERTVDFVNLFRNPSSEIAVDPKRFADRIDKITNTARLDPLRLASWIAAFCSLSLVWDYYPEGSPDTDRATAQLALDLIARSAN